MSSQTCETEPIHELHTIEAINRDYKREVEDLFAAYGGPSAIPKDIWDLCSETARARFILHTHPDADVQLLRQYGVPNILIERFVGDSALERKSRRADKYKAMLAWCQQNVDVQVTPDELADIGDVSRTTALKFMQDRVDLFRKIKRGLYEVRDRDQERAADK